MASGPASLWLAINVTVAARSASEAGDVEGIAGIGEPAARAVASTCSRKAANGGCMTRARGNGRSGRAALEACEA